MEHLIALSPPMVLARLANAKTCTRRLVSRSNSLVDGYPASKAQWEALDWSRAFVDRGPSIGGYPGPFWKVPNPAEGTIHRVYPRIQPGSTLAFKEALYREEFRGAAAAHYVADGAPVGAEGEIMGRPCPCPALWHWRVNKLAAMYCPRWAVRLRATVTSVTPSTPGAVGTPEEARAEGLYQEPDYATDRKTGEAVPMVYWRWRGRLESIHETPLDCYRALWELLHGEWAPDVPTWRIAFDGRPE